MDRQHVSRLTLSADWDPEEVGDRIHAEAQRRWDEGWIFERAETDALLESVFLYFKRPVPE